MQRSAPVNGAAERRIPSLDGLRAISIVLVLLGHLAGTRNFPLSAAVGNYWGIAHLGVGVFFVISGFLITGLLLDETARNGTIRLGRFYFRRTLRIFPAYYAFLAAVAIAGALGTVSLAPHDISRAMTYTSNYDAGRSWFVGHTWSLSVEEQFYLLWPAALLLSGSRRGLVIAVGVVLAVPVVRLIEWEALRTFSDGIGARFETVADAIAIGCVLACLRRRLHESAGYMRFLRSPLFVAVPVVAFAANMTHDHPLVYFVAGLTTVNIAVALCIDWCVTFPEGRVGRVLNATPLVYVGWLSYSLYLWQQPFLNRASTAPIAAFPLNIIIAVLLALISYYAVERPSLALRRGLERWSERRRAGAVVPLRQESAA